VTDLTEARSLVEPDGFSELEDGACAKTNRLVVDVLERKLLALEAIARNARYKCCWDASRAVQWTRGKAAGSRMLVTLVTLLTALTIAIAWIHGRPLGRAMSQAERDAELALTRLAALGLPIPIEPTAA
jgi:hypothetical protein